jgi:glutathione synthase/RimK-type ligase-like ATP-grasp enzyme
VILIAAEHQDVHAQRVANLLRDQRRSVSFVHATEFGSDRTLSFDPGSGIGVIGADDGALIHADDISAVWYRRPGRPHADDAIVNALDRAFTENEWQLAIDGFFSQLEARVVSPPFAQRAAIKPRQLAAARTAGLRIPETLITNDVGETLAFIEKYGRVVHKAMSAPPHRFLDTRTWGLAEEQHLQDIPLCPIMLQEEIEGPTDIRVTIVGQAIFAARIDRSERYPGPDSRIDLDSKCVAHTLPDDVSDALLLVMDRLGLSFATVDLKLTPMNEYVFFEINPQGQFLYIEILTEQPISAAVAGFLASA